MTYFDKSVSPAFVSLTIARTITALGFGLMGLFLPIFLYELLNESFILVVLYMAVGQFLYAISVPFIAIKLNTFGFRRALIISMYASSIFYGLFYFANKENILYIIPLTIAALTLFRLLYWLPYHIDMAKFTDRESRGRELSALIALQLILSVFIPLISGVIISLYGFEVLFLLGIAMFIVASLAYTAVPHAKEKFSWSVKKTWQELFKSMKTRVFWAYAAHGAENIFGFVVWPIFIFQLLKGDYFQVGALSTLITGVAVILQLTLGKYMDKNIRKEKVLGFGSWLYAFGWIFKIFILTAFHIFIAGVYHRVVQIFAQTPFLTLDYEMAADEGHYVDEYTVIKEMALNFGKVLIALIIIGVSLLVSLNWSFVFAAIAAIAFNLIRARDLDFAHPTASRKTQ